jgi:hypothetical protein
VRRTRTRQPPPASVGSAGSVSAWPASSSRMRSARR